MGTKINSLKPTDLNTWGQYTHLDGIIIILLHPVSQDRLPDLPSKKRGFLPNLLRKKPEAPVSLTQPMML